MGASQLHTKKSLNYRRGYASRSCNDCNDYVVIEITGIDGQSLGKQPRCNRIGLNPGRAYKINPKSICDAFDNSRLLARISRPKWAVPKTEEKDDK